MAFVYEQCLSTKSVGREAVGTLIGQIMFTEHSRRCCSN